MKAIIKYIFLTAHRDLLFISILTTSLIGIFVSAFLGSTALSENSQTQLVYMAGSSRFIIIIGLITFVCFHIKRSFDNKEIDVYLSRPISRSKIIISYLIGFTLLSIIIVAIISLNILLLNKPEIKGFLYWSFSFFSEVCITISFSMLASFIFENAVISSLSAISFYLLSRLMGFFTAGIKTIVYIPSLDNVLDWVSQVIIKIISIVIPRFDLFAKSSWLIYGVEDVIDLFFFPIQTIIYIGLMTAIAIYDFKKKEF